MAVGIFLLLLSVAVLILPWYVSHLAMSEWLVAELKTRGVVEGEEIQFGSDVSYTQKGKSLRLLSGTVVSDGKNVGEVSFRTQSGGEGEPPEAFAATFFSEDGTCEVVLRDKIKRCPTKKQKRRARRGAGLMIW